MFSPIPPMSHTKRVRSDHELVVWRARMQREAQRSLWPVRLWSTARKLVSFRHQTPAPQVFPAMPMADYQNKHA